MQLQLDRQDIHLLKEIAELGDVSPKVFDQDRRLERLELEGYVSSVRQDPPGSDAAPVACLEACAAARQVGAVQLCHRARPRNSKSVL